MVGMDITCSIEGCSNPKRARGWCTTHYQRWQRHGDPRADVINKPPDGEPLAYFYAHINDETDKCLEWPYAITDRGYGRVGVDGRQEYVHILACTRQHGPRPPGMEATHAPVICHNRACFNPRHLAWETPSTNNSTHKLLDGTAALGEQNPLARLTEVQVNEIRRRWAQGGRISKRALATEYGVSEMTIGRLLRGELWRQEDFTPTPRRQDGLTDAEVQTIRSRYESGEMQKVLAAEYGVGQSQISRIVRGWIGGKPPSA
jgi:hypothetical protein